MNEIKVFKNQQTKKGEKKYKRDTQKKRKKEENKK